MNILLMLSAVLMAGCQQDDAIDPAYHITLDANNTYVAGEPVKFNIHGNVDNILFYSGETGSQYVYKDRYEVPVEQIESAVLNLECQSRYGSGEGGLEIYVTEVFTGLKWDDGESDRAAVRSMVEGGMAGWTKLEYKEGASTVWTRHQYDVSEYMDNFSIAFHWCPEKPGQRTFWVNGSIDVAMKGAFPLSMNLKELGLNSLMMTEEVEPYHKDSGNGSIRFDSNNAQIAFQGGSSVAYTIDGWVFTSPAPLSRVANDQGIVIKNMQNYLHSYEYTWNVPGTYKVAFVGSEYINGKVMETVQHFTVNILPSAQKDDEPEDDKEEEEKDEYDVYLLIGQSNMAGRGIMLPGDEKVFDENVFLLDDKGEPVPAKNPLNQYSSIRKALSDQQICPGFGFSKKLSEETGRKILLVVNARGGSNMGQWTKGNADNYYGEAVRRAKEAMEYGQLKGILWHQGCSDVSRKDTYMEWLVTFVANLREDLGAEVPFVAGELGRWRSYVLPFNDMLRTIADHIPNSDWVSSEGGVPIVTATSNGEPDLKDAHFDRTSQIMLGERYADKILKMVYNQ